MKAESVVWIAGPQSPFLLSYSIEINMKIFEFVKLWIRRLLGLLLFIGKRPRHIAFIMDGNRRFASKNSIEKIQGHTHGYGKMIEVIRWCLELGVSYISVYAFSVDNFKRSPEEVSSLMVLAESKYKELAAENGLAEREGVEIRVIGNLSLAPLSVQSAAARMMKETSKIGAEKRRAVLNICFSYSSQEEVSQAREAISEAVNEGRLLATDFCPRLLHGALRTGNDCPPVDLLIRTSGETRLSDFMAVQCRNAHLCFVNPYWPDFTYLDFVGCVLGYQRDHPLEVRASLSRRRVGRETRGSWGRRYLWVFAMALIGFLPLEFDNAESTSMNAAGDLPLESDDDLTSWDVGKTEEEIAGREVRINAFLKDRLLERQRWIDEHAVDS